MPPETANSPSAAPGIESIETLLEQCQELILPDPTKCIATARLAHDAAREIDHRLYMGRALYWIGAGLRQTGDLVNASSVLRDANVLLHAVGDTRFQSRALQSIGAIHSASGELDEAINCFERALRLAKINADSYTITRILNSWGIVAIRQANYTRAFELYDECLEYLRNEPDPYLESSIFLNLAGIYQRIGDYDSALDSCSRAIDVQGRINDSRQDANCYVMKADTLCYLGRWLEAKEEIAKAMAVAKEHDYVDIEAIAYRTLVEVAKNVGDDSHSIEWLEEARTLAEATGNKIYLQKVELELGLALARIGQSDEARRTLLHALELAERARSPQLLAETHLALSEFFEQRAEIAKAVDHLKQALEQNAFLQSDANKLAVRRLERRVTPDSTRRVHTASTLVEIIAERQARIVQTLIAAMQQSLASVRTEAEQSGGAVIAEEADTLRHLLEQLSLVTSLG